MVIYRKFHLNYMAIDTHFSCPLCQVAGYVEIGFFRPRNYVFGGLIFIGSGMQFAAAYCHKCNTPIPCKSASKPLRNLFKAHVKNTPKLKLKDFCGLLALFVGTPIVMWFCA